MLLFTECLLRGRHYSKYFTSYLITMTQQLQLPSQQREIRRKILILLFLFFLIFLCLYLSKIKIQLKKKRQVGHSGGGTCGPRYSGAWGRRMDWGRELQPTQTTLGLLEKEKTSYPCYCLHISCEADVNGSLFSPQETEILRSYVFNS
jgi:hypothetical protein